MKTQEEILLSTIHLETYQVQIVNAWSAPINCNLGTIKPNETRRVTNHDDVELALDLAEVVSLCIEDGLRSDKDAMSKAKSITVIDTEFGYDIYAEGKDLIAIIEVINVNNK